MPDMSVTERLDEIEATLNRAEGISETEGWEYVPSFEERGRYDWPIALGAARRLLAIARELETELSDTRSRLQNIDAERLERTQRVIGLEAELAALKARTCETCKHGGPDVAAGPYLCWLYKPARETWYDHSCPNYAPKEAADA